MTEPNSEATTEPTRYEQICEQVRFCLDEPPDKIEPRVEQAEDFVAQIRMHALRVTPTTTPKLYQSLCRVVDALELDEPPEVYIINDPQANAFAPTFGIRNRPFMAIHSGLVKLLSIAEIEFAMGHELGHLGMHHRHGRHESEHESEYEALQYRSRQRYAEISADRIGLLASRSVYTAAHVMVKLASGLAGDEITLDIDAFLEQLDRHPEELNREWELHQSHPALPLRLWALLRFGETREYAQLARTGDGGRPLAEVDRQISSRLNELGDGRLDKIEADVYQAALTWVALSLVAEDKVINAQERAALKKLVGDDYATKAIKFVQSNGLEAVDTKLRETLLRISYGRNAAKARFVDSFYSFASSLEIQPESTRAWESLSQTLGSHLTSRQ